MKAVQIIVSGKVQGVFYRASTLEQANELGIKGWVRNLPDRSVEIFAYGDEVSVNDLIKWCHKGPFLSNVERVVHKDIETFEEPENFDIRY